MDFTLKQIVQVQRIHGPPLAMINVKVSGLENIQHLSLSWILGESCMWYSAVLTVNLFFKILQNTSRDWPVRARYRMQFVGSNSDFYSVSTTAVMYSVSCHIGPGYNGTQLYIVMDAYPVDTWKFSHKIAIFSFSIGAFLALFINKLLFNIISIQRKPKDAMPNLIWTALYLLLKCELVWICF